MGFYINPPGNKLDWLMANGKSIGNPFEVLFSSEMETGPATFREGDHVACCLVSNGAFDALGVAVDQMELEAFRLPDGRPKLWGWVPIAIAEKLSGAKVRELEG